MKRLLVVLPASLVLAAALGRQRAEIPTVPERAALKRCDLCPHGIGLDKTTRIPLSSSVPATASLPSTKIVDIDELLLNARRAFNTQWYSTAERSCREVLEAAPQDTNVWDLLDRIPGARLERMLYLKHTRGRLEIDSETLSDLTPEEWDDVIPRLLVDAAHPTSGGFPTVAAVHWALDTLKIDLPFDGWKLDSILDYIRDFSGLNLHVSAALRSRVDLDEPINLRSSDLPLRQALKMLAQQLDPRLEITVTEEKVVLIRDPRPSQME